MAIIDIIKDGEKTDEQKIQDIEQALTNGASLTEVDGETKSSVLHWATLNGGLKLFLWLLAKDNQLINAKNKYDTNVLFYALKHANKDIIQYFLSCENTDNFIHAKNKLLENVLHLLAMNNKNDPHLIELFSKKLSKDAFNCLNIDHETPLMIAASNNYWTMINYELDQVTPEEQKCKLETIDIHGNDVTGIAARGNCVNLLSKIYALKISMEKANNFGWYPIHIAVEKGNIDAVNFLLHKAKVNFKISQNNEHGNTPLMTALWYNQLKIFDLLFSNYTPKEQKSILLTTNKKGNSFAIIAAHIDYVTLLKNPILKPLLNTPNKLGWYPIHDAAEKGSIESLRYLSHEIKDGFKQPQANKEGYTPLMIAALNHQSTCFEFILSLYSATEQQAILRTRSKLGLSFAHMGAVSNFHELLIVLHQFKISLENEDNFGWYPIHLAAVKGNLNALKFLINDAKVDFKIKNKKNGITPLMLAIKYKQIEAVNLLLSSCANLHEQCAYLQIQTNDKKTALHFAAAFNFPILKQFHEGELKVPLVQKDINEVSLLDEAVLHDNLETLQYMLEVANCNYNRVNKNGDTPLTVAYKNKKEKTGVYLISLYKPQDLFAMLSNTPSKASTPRQIISQPPQSIQQQALLNQTPPHVFINRPLSSNAGFLRTKNNVIIAGTMPVPMPIHLLAQNRLNHSTPTTVQTNSTTAPRATIYISAQPNVTHRAPVITPNLFMPVSSALPVRNSSTSINIQTNSNTQQIKNELVISEPVPDLLPIKRERERQREDESSLEDAQETKRQRNS